MAEDPVCGKQVDEKNWVSTGGNKALHEGEAYYFCGLVCKQKFLRNPDRYLGTEEKEEESS